MFKRAGYYLTNLAQCCVIIAVFLVSSIVLAGAVGIVRSLSGIDLTKHYTVLYLLQMLPVTCFVLLSGRMRSRITGAGFVRVDAPHFGSFGGKRAVLLFFLLAAGTIAASIAADPVSDIFKMPENLRLLYGAMRDCPLDTFISVAVAAPLAEEFLLRGTIERGLLATSKRVAPGGRATYAILWSSFFFALIHFNLWQALPAFVLGVFFGWVYYRSHSIWACIFMHSVNNATAILSSVILPGYAPGATLKEYLACTTGSLQVYWIAVAVSAAILVSCIVLLNKYLPSAPDSFSPRPEGGFSRSFSAEIPE